MANEREITNITPGYYNTKAQNFRNTVYSLNIALEKKISKLLFDLTPWIEKPITLEQLPLDFDDQVQQWQTEIPGDMTRVVYSMTNFALRKRSSNGMLSNANMPFLNYKLKSITNTTSRKWNNSVRFLKGIYVEGLNRKLRMNPVTLNYQSTFWCNKDEDLQYAYNIMSFETSQEQESRVNFKIEMQNQEIWMLGIITWNLGYEPVYDEKEWLDSNKIHTLTTDFSVQTWMIMDNTDIIVPTSVVFDFAANNNQGNMEYTDALAFTIDHFNEVVTESSDSGDVL
jgi:hypothetical protein